MATPPTMATMPAIMSAPMGIPERPKWLCRPIRSMGTCISTPTVTAVTPRINAQRPRRSESVLALITSA